MRDSIDEELEDELAQRKGEGEDLPLGAYERILAELPLKQKSLVIMEHKSQKVELGMVAPVEVVPIEKGEKGIKLKVITPHSGEKYRHIWLDATKEIFVVLRLGEAVPESLKSEVEEIEAEDFFTEMGINGTDNN